MLVKTASLNLDFPVSYLLEGSGPGLLVLHGYSDLAIAACKRLLGSTAVAGRTVFAPNAVFPCPVRVGERFRAGYAWYYRNSDTGEFMVQPEYGAEALLKLMAQLGLAEREWTVLGFSQGGFFAPYLMRAGLRARRLIAVGSGFRVDAFRGLPELSVLALHGDADDIVPMEAARKSFDEISALGYGREFHVMPGVGHRVDDAGRAKIREWLLPEGGA